MRLNQPVRQCQFQQQALNPLLKVIHCQRLMLKTRHQGVERSVKMVSEASKTVYGRDARDGYILAALKSRRLIVTSSAQPKGLRRMRL